MLLIVDLRMMFSRLRMGFALLSWVWLRSWLLLCWWLTLDLFLTVCCYDVL